MASNEPFTLCIAESTDSGIPMSERKKGTEIHTPQKLICVFDPLHNSPRDHLHQSLNLNPSLWSGSAYSLILREYIA